jgi:hypothetical protein
MGSVLRWPSFLSLCHCPFPVVFTCTQRGDAVRHIHVFRPLQQHSTPSQRQQEGGTASPPALPYVRKPDQNMRLLDTAPPPPSLPFPQNSTHCVAFATLPPHRGDAVRHIDVFQTFAAALNTLAASAGGEQGLMQLLQSSGQGAAAAGGAALASSSNVMQVRVL